MYFTNQRIEVIIKTAKEKNPKETEYSSEFNQLKGENIMKKTLLAKIEEALEEYYGSFKANPEA